MRRADLRRRGIMRTRAGLAALGIILMITVLLCGILLPAAAGTAVLRSAAELDVFLVERATERAHSFDFSCSDAFFQELANSGFLSYYKYALKNGILSDHIQYSTQKKTVYISDVAYENPPVWIDCASEDEIVAAIQSMGSVGVSDFDLGLTRDLFARVSANSFSLLTELEARAGMLGYDSMSYYSEYGILLFSGARITADTPIFSTVGEVTAWFSERFPLLPDELVFCCDSDLYRLLMSPALSGNSTVLETLLLQNGVKSWSCSDVESAGRILLSDFNFYPGYKMAHAIRADRNLSLTESEQQTLNVANALAIQCLGTSDVETALLIHNALCDKITYCSDDRTEADDTAIGALLYGLANCDGYADAFMLTGSLAGLEVRLISGDAAEGIDTGYTAEGGHMWNLLRLDGTWRSVDLTWDDSEFGTRPTFFNIGVDLMERAYVWDPSLTDPILPITDRNSRPDSEYYVDSAADLEPLLPWCVSHAPGPFHIVFRDETQAGYAEELTNALLNRFYSLSSSWNEAIQVLTVTRVGISE